MRSAGRSSNTSISDSGDLKKSRKPVSCHEAEPVSIPESVITQNGSFAEISAEQMLGIQQVCGNNYVQRMAEGNSAVPQDLEIEEELNRHGYPGKALQPEVKGEMQKALGHNFDDIRIHDDSGANQLSSDLGAGAFTSGNDIYFKQGRYDPSSGKGSFLLGHELGHHIQQHEPGIIGGERQIVTDNVLETEADMAGEAVVNGVTFAISGSTSGNVQMGDEEEEGEGWFSRQWRGLTSRIPGTDAYENRVANALSEAINLFGEPALDAGMAAFAENPPNFTGPGLHGTEQSRHAWGSTLREVRTRWDDAAFTVDAIKDAWDIASVGGDILEVVAAFHAWNPDDAVNNPREYARNAGRALAGLGELGGDLLPDQVSFVGGYFDFLSESGSFFTDVIDRGLLEPGPAVLRSGEFRQGTRDEQAMVRSVFTE
jgi:hypothetical protein